MSLHFDQLCIINTKTLLDLPRSGLIAIYNRGEGKVLVLRSNSILMTLVRNLDTLRDKTHTYWKSLGQVENLEFCIIETTVSDIVAQKIRMRHWINELRKEGHEVLNKMSPIEPRLVELVENFKICLYLSDSNYRQVLLGIFDSVSEMEEFKEQYYGEGIGSLVYSCNRNTSEYYERIGRKRLY